MLAHLLSIFSAFFLTVHIHCYLCALFVLLPITHEEDHLALSLALEKVLTKLVGGLAQKYSMIVLLY